MRFVQHQFPSERTLASRPSNSSSDSQLKKPPRFYVMLETLFLGLTR